MNNSKLIANRVVETEAYKKHPGYKKMIIKNKENLKRIDNGLQVSKHIGFEAWQRQTKAQYYNQEIIQELLTQEN